MEETQTRFQLKTHILIRIETMEQRKKQLREIIDLCNIGLEFIENKNVLPQAVSVGIYNESENLKSMNIK